MIIQEGLDAKAIALGKISGLEQAALNRIHDSSDGIMQFLSLMNELLSQPRKPGANLEGRSVTIWYMKDLKDSQYRLVGDAIYAPMPTFVPKEKENEFYLKFEVPEDYKIVLSLAIKPYFRVTDKGISISALQGSKENMKMDRWMILYAEKEGNPNTDKIMQEWKSH